MERGFTQIPNLILTETKLSAQARIIYCILMAYDWQNKDGKKKGFVWPSQQTLADEAGFSVKSIQLYLDELEASGLIHKVHTPQVKTLIYVLREEPCENWNPVRRKSGKKKPST